MTKRALAVLAAVLAIGLRVGGADEKPGDRGRAAWEYRRELQMSGTGETGSRSRAASSLGALSSSGRSVSRYSASRMVIAPSRPRTKAGP